MLTSAALLALCVQVADLSALYLSFEPSGAATMDAMDEARDRWSLSLRSEVSDNATFVAVMHDGFVSAMAMDGDALWGQWNACVAELDGAPSPGPMPGGKG